MLCRSKTCVFFHNQEKTLPSRIWKIGKIIRVAPIHCG
jgi:hypothetical protein